MASLRKLFERDPYDWGPNGGFGFSVEDTFLLSTATGYAVRGHILCSFECVDRGPFKAARMLEDESQRELLKTFCREVFWPAMSRRGRKIRLLRALYPLPALCHKVEDASGAYMARDRGCDALNEDLRTSPFTGSGCKLTFVRFKLLTLDETVIGGNYHRMTKLYDAGSIEGTEEFVAAEEAMVVALAKRESQIKALFAEAQTDQKHCGERVEIRTRRVGRAVEISWIVDPKLAPGQRLLGFRREGGFELAPAALQSNGVCVVDARATGGTTQSLREGCEQFYTFVVTEKRQDGEAVLETIRFSVRVPTAQELSRLEELATSFGNKPAEEPDPRRKQIDDALKELSLFVEFDEALSDMEKSLAQRIAAKGYSEEEWKERMERLKLLVGDIRARAT